MAGNGSASTALGLYRLAHGRCQIGAGPPRVRGIWQALGDARRGQWRRQRQSESDGRAAHGGMAFVVVVRTADQCYQRRWTFYR
ncbi:hypothetical protein EV589_4074 [Mycobacterium sp. BK558]|nr:hypothetical protein EV589_4074 [Mycobacterium sp. BK558]